ncbi:hypothetical protein TA3x_002640 [Tundrisphaera sp. TA3]|uniref:hypothetical protein n=1 Tax=Tundrisphaera sp. TA3 TaxID=3435775 RepID=UPI003EB8ADEF
MSPGEGAGDPAGESLIPPRPNLGPEPWEEPGGLGPAWIGGGLALALALILVARRRRLARKRPAGESDGPSDGGAGLDPWVAASERAREALVRAFGPGWRSRTTEEIEADPMLADRLGPDHATRLVALFRRADLAKFADPPPSPEDGPGPSDLDPLMAAIGGAGRRGASGVRPGDRP